MFEFAAKWKNCSSKGTWRLNKTICEFRNVGTAATDGTRTHKVGMEMSNLQSIIQLCAELRGSANAKSCHAQVLQIGMKQDVLTINMLMNAYTKCRMMEYAQKLFDEMPERSVVSWNTMIGTYGEEGIHTRALALFKEMRLGGLLSQFTISSIICACASHGDVSTSLQLHALAVKVAMDADVFVGTSLVDFYGKIRLVDEAERAFEEIPEKSEVTWTSMAAVYVQNQLHSDAMIIFSKAHEAGKGSNQFMLSSITRACADLAVLNEGKQLHAMGYKTGLSSNSFLASSLINMYARCGVIEDAYTIFMETDKNSIVLWNVLIGGFAKHSCCLQAMILFEKMQQMRLLPDQVAYLTILTACSHMGSLDKFRRYCNLMKEHNVAPNIHHVASVIDTFGRRGLFVEALALMKTMPLDPTASMWGSILASSTVHGNHQVAEIAAKKLFCIEPENAGNYVLLSNMHAAAMEWAEVAETQKHVKESVARKEKGMSWIEISDKVHKFMAGERTHPQIHDIYTELGKIMREMKKTNNCKFHEIEDNITRTLEEP